MSQNLDLYIVTLNVPIYIYWVNIYILPRLKYKPCAREVAFIKYKFNKYMYTIFILNLFIVSRLNDQEWDLVIQHVFQVCVVQNECHWTHKYGPICNMLLSYLINDGVLNNYIVSWYTVKPPISSYKLEHTWGLYKNMSPF